MKNIRQYMIPLLVVLFLWVGLVPAGAGIWFQCPTQEGGAVLGDNNDDGMIRADDGEIVLPVTPDQVCMHLTGGDGFGKMADGVTQYLFSFANVTGKANNEVMAAGALAAEWPAPTIELKEGDVFYLTLSNVGMHIRPDLFDPHTVHYHGLPHSSNIYDGLPESGIAINMGSSLTYYYLNAEPGTYMYHCHVEATEHMQMGMLGNLYVDPIQNRTGIGGTLEAPETTTQAGKEDGNGPWGYAYNDGDGSTAYDVAYPIQLGGFDREFHDASWDVQPLPFAPMWDDYPMINGRGYPDTANPGNIPAPVEAKPLDGFSTQRVSSLITAKIGQRVLLRISNLNVTRFHTIASTIPMQVVAKDARLLRAVDPDGDGPLLGKNLYYTTNSVTLGGGESYDVILDTAKYSGKHFLYTANLNLLSNDIEDFGGMMTEIHLGQ